MVLANAETVNSAVMKTFLNKKYIRNTSGNTDGRLVLYGAGSPAQCVTLEEIVTEHEQKRKLLRTNYLKTTIERTRI